MLAVAAKGAHTPAKLAFGHSDRNAFEAVAHR